VSRNEDKISPPPHKIDSPELVNKKVSTVDYVHKRTPYTKFGTNPPTQGFWANGWNITKKYFYLYLFFLRFAYRSDPWVNFYARQLKRLEITQGCAFWASERCPSKFWGKTPKNWNFGCVNRTFKSERQKIQILITWKLRSRSRRNFHREYAPRIRLREWSHGSPTNPRWRRPPSLISGKCLTPDWIKISTPDVIGRCITAMRRWPLTKSRSRKLICVTSSNEGLKDKCVDLSDYNR